MNLSMISYVLGKVMLAVGAFMGFPVVTALVYHEEEFIVYFCMMLFMSAAGWLLSRKKPKNSTFYLKDGCIMTALSWILMSLMGAFPMMITGEVPEFVNAWFEAVSGFTTTGASVIADVGALSKTTVMWRSTMHWVGGMGVLVFILAIVPMSGGSNINLMKAESPGPSVGKLVPKLKQSAQILYALYIGLALVQMTLLLFGGMDLFDALTCTFGTAGTGGFSFRGDAFATVTPYCQWVTSVFMIIFSLNFNFFYFLVFRQFRKAYEIEEVRVYLVILIAAMILIFSNVVHLYPTVEESLRHTVFQVASIASSTGYSTADFNTWSTSSQTILVILMFIGACAGSTGGGFKVSRVVILFKTVGKELRSFIHPKRVEKIQIDGRPLEHEVQRSVNVYMVTYLLVILVSVLLVSMEGYDLTTNFTAVVATFNNIGPGLSLVGPTENFLFFNDFSKYVLIFDMLAGRLELFPLLLLFHPSIWRDAIRSSRKKREFAYFHD